jgi:hypothetical protein
MSDFGFVPGLLARSSDYLATQSARDTLKRREQLASDQIEFATMGNRPFNDKSKTRACRRFGDCVGTFSM